MELVRVGSLLPGCEFKTSLTRRTGVVVRRREEGPLVLLEPFSGSELEQKLVSRHVLVRVVGFNPVWVYEPLARRPPAPNVEAPLLAAAH
jgi:hypothetical protein